MLAGITQAVTNPRSTWSWILRGYLARDPVFVSQTYWFTGTLPRVPLSEALPGIENVEVVLPRAFDRKRGTSTSVEEASHLGAIARFTGATKALEIGTFDGNTTLILAANLAPGGRVVTVDLPPDFGVDNKGSLAFTDVELNLTERDQLGRQYKGHALSTRITQVCGDSGSMNWDTLGGPFNLIFIDGCHSEAYVRSDTENALKHLSPKGLIVWHDYGMIPDVSTVVDQFARENNRLRVFAVEGTRLAIGLT
jgi:predicted O-methyltransferase YrrM